MKKLAFIALSLIGGPALAADAASLAVKLGGIENGQPIPSKFAYCMPDGKGKSGNGGNISPAISWSGAPESTKSFAILVVDPDVPASFDAANKDGQVIAADFPRQNFYHWVLVDIPATMTSLPEGKDSAGITPGGKPGGKMEYGIDGINDYAKAGMGKGGGYDGSCPPWNDERLHHYHFKVMALDIASLNLSGNFTGPQAEKAMDGHVLATGETVGTYTDNAKVAGK